MPLGNQNSLVKTENEKYGNTRIEKEIIISTERLQTLESKTSNREEIFNLDLQTLTQKWRENSSPFEKLNPRNQKLPFTCVLLLLYSHPM